MTSQPNPAAQAGAASQSGPAPSGSGSPSGTAASRTSALAALLHGRPPRPGVTGPVLDSVEAWTRVGLGALAFAAAQSDRHLLSTVTRTPGPDGVGRYDQSSTTLPAVLPGATFGLALAGQSALFDVIASTEVRVAAIVGLLSRRSPAGWASRRMMAFLEPWDQRWRADQRTHADAAAAFLASIGPSTLDELLGRIDVERVVDRVPVDYVVDRIDVNSIAAEIASELRYTDLVRESTNAIFRESTGVLAATTAEVVRGQVGAVTRFTSFPFRGRQQANPAVEPNPANPANPARQAGPVDPVSPANPADQRALADTWNPDPESAHAPAPQPARESAPPSSSGSATSSTQPKHGPPEPTQVSPPRTAARGAAQRTSPRATADSPAVEPSRQASGQTFTEEPHHQVRLAAERAGRRIYRVRAMQGRPAHGAQPADPGRPADPAQPADGTRSADAGRAGRRPDSDASDDREHGESAGAGGPRD